MFTASWSFACRTLAPPTRGRDDVVDVESLIGITGLSVDMAANLLCVGCQSHPGRRKSLSDAVASGSANNIVTV